MLRRRRTAVANFMAALLVLAQSLRCSSAFATGAKLSVGKRADYRAAHTIWHSSSSSRQLLANGFGVVPKNPPGLGALPTPDVTSVAEGLGYFVGAGSLLLYTPIAVRVIRQGSADGLTLSTWWLKLCSYTCSDIYAFSRGYPLSAYAETLIITAEASVILVLVAFFQGRISARFAGLGLVFSAAVFWALAAPAPAAVTALGQAGSTVLNTGALLPQLLLNAERRSPGDYSPVTAGLAALGCAIRLFTTVQLADSDLMLLGGFGVAFLLNSALFAQILWYGISVEGRSLASVMMADIGSTRVSDDIEIEQEEVELEPLKTRG
mmetsp:Transcript_2149/g.5702  ORF Transcript_2149/g.5702 Transcript_2149/m.5702 type:complete len:322 (-) Transcript_2149:285-1250(-)